MKSRSSEQEEQIVKEIGILVGDTELATADQQQQEQDQGQQQGQEQQQKQHQHHQEQPPSPLQGKSASDRGEELIWRASKTKGFGGGARVIDWGREQGQ